MRGVRSAGDEMKQRDERVREADACDWSDHNERRRAFLYLCVPCACACVRSRACVSAAPNRAIAMETEDLTHAKLGEDGAATPTVDADDM